MKSTDLVRKRLVNEYLIHGSYARLAYFYGVNVRYIWDFINNGTVPSKEVWKKIRCAWWVKEAADNLAELREKVTNADHNA